MDLGLNTDISIKHTAVVTIDDDIPQLNAMKEEIELYNNNRIKFGKLSAASSHLEAACDKSPIFRIIKEELPKHNVRNIPPQQC